MEGIWKFLFEPYESYTSLLVALEIIAAFCGVASVIFAWLENIWVYPFGIISTAIYVYILADFGLYGDMGINAYYFVMSIYGWYNWQKSTPQEGELKISWAGRRDNLLGLLLLALSFPIFAMFLDNFTDSTVPWIDGFTTSIFFMGMWFMARKQVENWIYWIVGDLISIPLYHYKGLTFTSIQYFIFLGLAVGGWIAWMKKARQTPAYAN